MPDTRRPSSAVNRPPLTVNRPPSAVVTFGEIMMRLTAPDNNVLHKPASWGLPTAAEKPIQLSVYRTGGIPRNILRYFPDNDLGRAAGAFFQKRNRTARVISCIEGATGFVFYGSWRRVAPSRIVYDRYDSAFAQLDPPPILIGIISCGCTLVSLDGDNPCVRKCRQGWW